MRRAVNDFRRPAHTGKIHGVQIDDVIDPAALADALTAGHVREQTHPSEPLAILNYTELCAFAGEWNPTTLACRGLIYRTDTREVVARGYVKFFNHGQAGAPDVALDAPVHVSDKADGSLGIIYPVPSGGWAVATRGSFASDQAMHATTVLAERYGDYEPTPDATTLVEIVYPENRIVLDYGDTDDLILLGGVELGTGAVLDVDAFPTWRGPRTEVFEAATFADALALPPRPNAEGIVVRDLTTGHLVKIKQADYVELHRIVTNLTARRIHEAMLAGMTLAEFIAPLPDEFHAWCVKIAEGITAAVDDSAAQLDAAFQDVVAQMPVGWSEQPPSDRQTRAAFAKVAARHRDKWALFALLDGRDIRPELLKRAQPEPFLTPTGRGRVED